MANSSLVVFSIFVAAVGLIYVEAGGVIGEEGWSMMSSMKTAAGSCAPGRSIAECSKEEFALDSETSRRMLAGNNGYISYGALQRNTVPCSRRGQSYYNCQPGAPANPYTRGCSAITQCRS